MTSPTDSSFWLRELPESSPDFPLWECGVKLDDYRTCRLVFTIKEDGRPFALRFTVDVPAHSPVSVGAVDIRRMSPAQMLRDAMAVRHTWSGPDAELRATAEVYRAARDEKRDPVDAVARALGVGRTTASNRIRESRLKGYLAPRRARGQG
jgi:hypothetical protein